MTNIVLLPYLALFTVTKIYEQYLIAVQHHPARLAQSGAFFLLCSCVSEQWGFRESEHEAFISLSVETKL